MAVKAAGQIAIVRFPQTDLEAGKPRPVLLLAETPGSHNDWLVCMLSTQLRHAVSNFDEVIDSSQSDFQISGLRTPSLIRLGRLAVINSNQLLGRIGHIDSQRLKRIRGKIANWVETGSYQ
jgi:mRNA interferase MazF